eukprot:5451869-Prymnesium_polylepis.1
MVQTKLHFLQLATEICSPRAGACHLSRWDARSTDAPPAPLDASTAAATVPSPPTTSLVVIGSRSTANAQSAAKSGIAA